MSDEEKSKFEIIFVRRRNTDEKPRVAWVGVRVIVPDRTVIGRSEIFLIPPQ